MTFDLIIKGGTILDGVTDEGRLEDIGILKGQIRTIGNLHAAKASRVIAAADKYVVPGFVDIQNHSDSYLTLLEIPSQESLVGQGITTIAVGHCGTSLAPLPGPEALKSIQKWHSLAGANLNWQNFQEYLKALRDYPLGVNVVSLVGHSTLRRGLLRDEVRPTTPEETKIMVKLVDDSLAAGAAGMSLGLIYAHEADTSASELIALSQAVAERNRLLSVHLRSEGRHVVDALNEILSVAAQTRARLKISHFKIQGAKNWPYFEEALATVDHAYQKGLDIFFDVYPYTTSWTVLYTYLPKWAYEGGRSGILQNLKDPAKRNKILSFLRDQEQDFGRIIVATSETNQAFIGRTLKQIAANQEITVAEALLNVLAATSAQVVVFDHDLSDELTDILLKHPLAVVSSDGAGYDYNFSPSRGLVHPRCFGTMPKFLAKVRDKKLMSWAEAIKRVSSRPASKLGLTKRGQLREGYYADVVVFDPREIGSKASYENPYQQADGIEYVLVNGQIAFAADDNSRSSAGQVLQIAD